MDVPGIMLLVMELPNMVTSNVCNMRMKTDVLGMNMLYYAPAAQNGQLECLKYAKKTGVVGINGLVSLKCKKNDISSV